MVSAKKGTTAKKTAAAKKNTAAKKSTASTASIKVTAAEKKLLELYREADAETRKNVLKLLRGEQDADDAADSILEDILGVVQTMLENK